MPCAIGKFIVKTPDKETFDLTQNRLLACGCGWGFQKNNEPFMWEPEFVGIAVYPAEPAPKNAKGGAMWPARSKDAGRWLHAAKQFERLLGSPSCDEWSRLVEARLKNFP